MAQYDDTNSFVLFPNKNKQNEGQPDVTGKINIDGVEKRLAGWKKQSKSGVNFISGKVSDFQEKKEQPKATEEVEDVMPF